MNRFANLKIFFI